MGKMNWGRHVLLCMVCHNVWMTLLGHVFVCVYMLLLCFCTIYNVFSDKVDLHVTSGLGVACTWHFAAHLCTTAVCAWHIATSICALHVLVHVWYMECSSTTLSAMCCSLHIACCNSRLCMACHKTKLHTVVHACMQCLVVQICICMSYGPRKMFRLHFPTHPQPWNKNGLHWMNRMVF